MRCVQTPETVTCLHVTHCHAQVRVTVPRKRLSLNTHIWFCAGSFMCTKPSSSALESPSPMSLQYQQRRTFTNGHTNGVMDLQFNASGDLLASAGLDNLVCIWSVQDAKLLHTVRGTCPTLSLAWIPGQGETLMCGLRDGSIGCISINHAPVCLSFRGHRHLYSMEFRQLCPSKDGTPMRFQ